MGEAPLSHSGTGDLHGQWWVLVDALSMGIYKYFLSSLRRFISPDGEVLSLLVQRKYPKKARPDGPGRYATTLRCSASEAAAQLTSAVRGLRMFGQCSPTAPQSPVLLGGPNGGPEKVTAPHVGRWINQKERHTTGRLG